MKNSFTFVAIEVDEDFNSDTFDEITYREEDYILQELVRCAVHMYENNDYDENVFFQLIWNDCNTDFTLDKNNIIEQLGSALKHFEDKEEYEFCTDIKELIDKIKNNI